MDTVDRAVFDRVSGCVSYDIYELPSKYPMIRHMFLQKKKFPGHITTGVVVGSGRDKGGEKVLRVGFPVVTLSEKIFIWVVLSRVYFLDLENGNLVSRFNPGGTSYLLGNLIDFYRTQGLVITPEDMRCALEDYVFEGGGSLQELDAQIRELASLPEDSPMIRKLLWMDFEGVKLFLSSYLNHIFLVVHGHSRGIYGQQGEGFEGEERMIANLDGVRGEARETGGVFTTSQSFRDFQVVKNYLEAMGKSYTLFSLRDRPEKIPEFIKLCNLDSYPRDIQIHIARQVGVASAPRVAGKYLDVFSCFISDTMRADIFTNELRRITDRVKSIT